MNFNAQNVKNLISGLIHMEKTLEHKLDLLTEIGLTARNEIIFKTCEEIRSEICETERSSDEADSKKRPSGSVASKRERKEAGSVLHPEQGTSLYDENGLRKKLEAVLSTLNLRKQKTFEFEGLKFHALLVKHFFKECKNIPDLAVAVYPEDETMCFVWANGTATLHAYPLAEKIKAELKEAREMLK